MNIAINLVAAVQDMIIFVGSDRANWCGIDGDVMGGECWLNGEQ